MNVRLDLQALEQAIASGRFAQSAYLTFCLSGGREQLEATVGDLTPLGGLNLEGAETGFVNAKLPTRTVLAAIAACIGEVEMIAKRNNVVIAGIDLDSEAAVERARFANISAAT